MSKRLELAVNALRDTTSGEESGAACYTRSRVLAAVRQRERRRALHLAFGIPLAALLMGSVAWAATDQHFTLAVRYFSAVTHLRPARTQRSKSKPMSVNATPTQAQPVPAREQAFTDITPVASVTATEPAAAADTPSVRVTSRDNNITERDLTLYESAHRAHFVDKDWSAALSAWEKYLRTLPHGRFALEARYNRALCLVRLGRSGEAAQALSPFAQGTFGNYRQREAKTLLEQVEGSTR